MSGELNFNAVPKSNLVLNAYQAMQRKGALAVTTSSSDGKIIIRLQDNGPGIPPENLDKIFEPFFSTKAPGEGTGLGLYIARDIVTQANGTIRAESELHRGSVFSFVLPAVTSTP